MLNYTFKEGPVTLKNAKDADPQQIGEALAKVAAKHGGRLEPAHAVEEARNRRSPLHRHFEWNDRLAATSYRLQQAREMIRIIRVRDDNDKEGEVRHAFLSISDTDGVSYRTVGEVLNNVSLQLLVMKQALRDLKAWESRYQDLSEVCVMVRTARERLEGQVRASSTGMEVRPS